ncbi:MAG: hypothetical protein E6868_14285 [Pantoea sp.]|uniref:CDI toxin immunity protein n=1 Tax=Pantoea TaxID=53335 RepID=UPI0028B006C4|nr:MULTISPECIES: hypothetical protein [Pantoea]MDU1574408.1 hypothetical protein [Pantoea sp.]
MTLFEECREALSADFYIVEGGAQEEALGILNGYPIVKGNVTWSAISHSDYEDIDELLSANIVKNDDMFVFVDDANIPMFKSNLKLISSNIYDVTALSPKLFIFNDEVIIQPLFPTDMFRLGMKSQLKE